MSASAARGRSSASSKQAATPTTSCARASPRLTDEPGVVWAGIAFVEDGALALGPSAGSARRDAPRRACRSSSRARAVGELWVDGDDRPDDARAGRDAHRAVRPDRLGHRRRGLGPVAAGRLNSIEGASLVREGYLVRGIASPNCVTTRRLGRGEGSRALVLWDGRAVRTPPPTGRGTAALPSPMPSAVGRRDRGSGVRPTLACRLPMPAGRRMPVALAGSLIPARTRVPAVRHVRRAHR